MTADITCARCGQSHMQLEFEPLTKASIIPTTSGRLVLNAWAMCPDLHEPILIENLENKE